MFKYLYIRENGQRIMFRANTLHDAWAMVWAVLPQNELIGELDQHV